MFNNDLKYAFSRINNTFMMSKVPNKGLVKILEMKSGDNNDLATARITFLTKRGEVEEGDISELKFSVGKLGYVNSQLSGEAMYISRAPVRLDYKQGLNTGQLTHIKPEKFQNLKPGWLETQHKAVSECLEGEYPKLGEVIEQVEEFNTQVAFSKCFAISRKYKLLYKEMVAGVLTSDDKVKLNNEFSFAEEELIKEVGNENFSR